MASLVHTLVINARRAWLGFIVGFSAATMNSYSLAQNTDTTRILVGFPAGGGTDAIARILADELKGELNSSVVVENKPGAGGQIAAQTLKTATPDGRTLFISHDHTITILPLVMKNAGFDSHKDFVPVAGFATFVNAFALSSQTAGQDFKAYVANVKQQGGKSAVGIPAPASVPQFLVQIIGKKNNLDLISVPYKGSAPMMGDMLANQIAAGVASIPDLIENHRAGKIRIVAVMGTKRQALLPDVPTLAELGLNNFEEVPFYGLFAPAATPKATLDKIATALEKTLNKPHVREKLTAMGLSVGFMSAEQLAAREHKYSQVWKKIIEESGFVPQ